MPSSTFSSRSHSGRYSGGRRHMADFSARRIATEMAQIKCHYCNQSFQDKELYTLHDLSHSPMRACGSCYEHRELLHKYKDHEFPQHDAFLPDIAMEVTYTCEPFGLDRGRCYRCQSTSLPHIPLSGEETHVFPVSKRITPNDFDHNNIFNPATASYHTAVHFYRMTLDGFDCCGVKLVFKSARVFEKKSGVKNLVDAALRRIVPP